MILDSSAVIAILFQEAGYEDLVAKIATAGVVGIGTPTLAECSLVLTWRAGGNGRTLLGRFLQRFGIVEIPFTPDHWRAAQEAFERFGKGRHPAGLNFGDCLSYAVARTAGQPLLFIGNDFIHTDLESA